MEIPQDKSRIYAKAETDCGEFPSDGILDLTQAENPTHFSSIDVSHLPPVEGVIDIHMLIPASADSPTLRAWRPCYVDGQPFIFQVEPDDPERIIENNQIGNWMAVSIPGLVAVYGITRTDAWVALRERLHDAMQGSETWYRDAWANLDREHPEARELWRSIVFRSPQ